MLWKVALGNITLNHQFKCPLRFQCKNDEKGQRDSNDLQGTTQKARDKQCSTKHHTESKGQTMICKAPHRKQGTNNDLQNTTQKARDKQ